MFGVSDSGGGSLLSAVSAAAAARSSLPRLLGCLTLGCRRKDDVNHDRPLRVETTPRLVLDVVCELPSCEELPQSETQSDSSWLSRSDPESEEQSEVVWIR